MFEKLDRVDCELIYRGLKSSIETSGSKLVGLHNQDKQHPFYMLGSGGELEEESDAARERDRNQLFAMLSELSSRLKEDGDVVGSPWFYDFTEWQDFCRFVVQSDPRTPGVRPARWAETNI